MPIRFLCPMGHPLIVPDDLAGTEARCPICRQRVLIPVLQPDDGIGELAPTQGGIQSVDSLESRAAYEPVTSRPPLGSGSLSSGGVIESPAARHEVERDIVLPPPIPPVPQAHRYVAPAGRIRSAYGVAAAAGILAFITATPALGELARPPAPAWVWILILSSIVQAGYALWLASLPDWSTVWLGMALFAMLAAADALGLALGMATPANRALPLGLDEVRSSLAPWCAARLALDGGLAYTSGWLSARWRREYVDAKAAARRHP